MVVEDNTNLQESPLLESILFSFIEEVRFGATQINNFRATVSLKMRKYRKNYLHNIMNLISVWIFVVKFTSFSCIVHSLQ